MNSFSFQQLHELLVSLLFSHFLDIVMKSQKPKVLGLVSNSVGQRIYFQHAFLQSVQKVITMIEGRSGEKNKVLGQNFASIYI